MGRRDQTHPTAPPPEEWDPHQGPAQQHQHHHRHPSPQQRVQRHRRESFGASTLRRKYKAAQQRTEVGICTKYFLFFENCILFLLGLALTAIGAYILTLKEKKVQDTLDFFLDPACDMCLVGAFIFVLSFLGCTGALRENTCFLRLFYYVVLLLLLLELALAVCLFLVYYVDDVRDVLFPKDSFSNAIVNYRNDKDMQNLIDSLQQSLGCCGLSNSETGYEDWNQNMYFNCTEDNASPERCSVPPSCCKMEAGTVINLYCGANIYTLENGLRTTSDTSKIYTSGCIKALGDWINEHSLVVGGVMLGVLLPQIFIICLVRNLVDMINAQKSKWNR